jgi:hypothetical protein
MGSIFILLLAILSSLLLWVWGQRRLGLKTSRLASAVASALECLGLTAVIYGANLALGVAVTAMARVASGSFLSLYPTTDPVLALLSLLQALVFWHWRQGRKG